MLSVAPALENELEPFHKLRRFVLNPSVSSTLHTPVLLSTWTHRHYEVTFSTIASVCRGSSTATAARVDRLRCRLSPIKQSSQSQNEFQTG